MFCFGVVFFFVFYFCGFCFFVLQTNYLKRYLNNKKKGETRYSKISEIKYL